ncbi:MAG: hypothetical protein ACREUZ_08690, partial [Burkholderiales bacterium]
MSPAPVGEVVFAGIGRKGIARGLRSPSLQEAVPIGGAGCRSVEYCREYCRAAQLLLLKQKARLMSRAFWIVEQ